jgi:hypothetical protein
MQRSILTTLLILLGSVLILPAGAGQVKNASALDRLRPQASDPLPRLLALDSRQTARLDRLYDAYARVRLEQEAKMAGWHDELRQARAQTPPDERKAARLERDIKQAEQKIARAFLKSRKDALKVLEPIQRAWMQWLWNHHQVGPHDRYCDLLAGTAEDMWLMPVDADTARRLLTPDAFTARSPAQYRYYSAPYSFHSYGYGLNDPDSGDHRHTTKPIFRW